MQIYIFVELENYIILLDVLPTKCQSTVTVKFAVLLISRNAYWQKILERFAFREIIEFKCYVLSRQNEFKYTNKDD